MEQGTPFPPNELTLIHNTLYDHLLMTTNSLAKKLGVSRVWLNYRLYYLLGKGEIGALDVREKYPVVDAYMEVRYWYVKEREKEAIRWVQENFRITHWKKLV